MFYFSPIDSSDFEDVDRISVVNTTKFLVLTLNDSITLEYDDKIILTFTPDDPDLISDIESRGEYIRHNATVQIIDNDSKNGSHMSLIPHLLSPLPSSHEWHSTNEN